MTVGLRITDIPEFKQAIEGAQQSLIALHKSSRRWFAAAVVFGFAAGAAAALILRSVVR